MALLNDIASFAGRPHARLFLAAAPAELDGQSPPTDPAAYAAALLQLLEVVSDLHHPTSEHEAVIDAAVSALINGAQHAYLGAPVVTEKTAGHDNHIGDSMIAARQHVPVRGSSATRSALGGALLVLNNLQSTLGQGPAVDAADGGRQVLVQDLHIDARWPQLTTRAPWQILSILCTPLYVAGSTHVLTALSTQAWAFDDTSTRQAGVVAAHLSLALTHAEHFRNLTAMAANRDVIGQAKGIVMQQHRCTASQAFDLLTKVSQRSNIPVRALSEYLTHTGELPAQLTGDNTREGGERPRQ